MAKQNFENKIKLVSDDEEDEDPSEYELGKKVKFDIPIGELPVFSYKYLLVGNQEYSSLSGYCDVNDYQLYFKRVKELSCRTIENLRNSPHSEKLYFHFEYPNQKQFALLKAVSGINHFSSDRVPMVGQFGLCPSNDYVEGGKCQRVHFFIGANAILYVMAFDLFHTIHPMGKH